MKRLLAATIVSILVTCIVPGVRAGTIYHDNFDGSSGLTYLNGSAPDVDYNGGTNTWLAYGNTTNTTGYKEDGTLASANVSQGAWLPFTPLANNVYTLSASLTNVLPDGTSVAWYAIGFVPAMPTVANSQSNSSQNRMVEGVTAGRAWMLFRPNNPTTPTDSPNVSHLGSGTSGTVNNPVWTDATLARAEGGDIDMLIVLNTYAATWTADFFAKRPADSSYTEVSAGPQNLLVNDITAVGIARTAGTLNGHINSFDLSVPEPASSVLVALSAITLGIVVRRKW